MEKLKAVRPYVIVGAFVVAAVVTPPDAISQLLLAVPMCLLFEFGLILARLMDRFLGKYGAKGDDEVDGPSDPAEAE